MTAILDTDTASPEDAAHAIDEHGCFVLRGAFPAGEMDELDRLTRSFFQIANEGAEALAPLVKRTPDLIRDRVKGATERGVIHYALPSLYAFKNPEELAHRFTKMLGREKVRALLRGVLDAEPVLHLNNLALRIREPSKPEFSLPFHQDGVAYERALLESTPSPVMLVIWTPFTGCDDKTPGLEVVPRRTRETYALADAPKTKFGYLEAAVEEGALPVWYPHLAPGDAIVFADLTLHRSYSGPVSRTRTSVDLRVFADGKFPRALDGHAGIRLSDSAPVKFAPFVEAA